MSTERWLDEEAGPVVRPYAMTRGRTRPSAEAFDLIALVCATGDAPAGNSGLGPEHLRLLDLCRRAATVADLASSVDLPLGVVRVLLGDLLDQRLVSVRRPASAASVPDENLLKDVINGLKAL
ncbi:DUF742 domain-containing protein [Bailinhaonella thermotolerans]|uniref:DUF742 domain-containing protein n=1 Tax=Bailinhaonella thermotolerans TaxID=1070861 RepID=A0A3A4B3D2_9ACTN|nr:DUF742 domain-containing protein [Bailinhaonella thermotolerans]RJL32685.1 DUF742 domain-containing protein [Bailinhaonella thermotolerans]